MDMRDFTRRPDRSARLRRVAALFPLALAAVLGACEGSNLFGDDGSAIGAPVVKLEAPDSATTGGVVDLKIQASSERRVAGIDVRLRVAMQRDTTLIISPPRSSVNEIFSFQVGEDAIAGPLVVMVSARDDAGSVGEVVTDTIHVVDRSSPLASVRVDPDEVGTGAIANIVVVVRDNTELGTLGLRVLDEDGVELDRIEPAPLEAGSMRDSVVIHYPVAEDFPLGPAKVVAIGHDAAGNAMVSDTATMIVFDGTQPHVTILQPADSAGIGPGERLRVRVQVHDGASGIESVRFRVIEYRGDFSIGQGTIVDRFEEVVVPFPKSPLDTFPEDIVVRELVPTSDLDPALAHLIVEAKDRAGLMAADTHHIFIGGTMVQILEPTQGQLVGADGPLPITYIVKDASRTQIRLSGAQSGTFGPFAVTGDTMTSIVNLDAGIEGSLEIAVTAIGVERNVTDVVTVNVVNRQGTDDRAPEMAYTILSPSSALQRFELTDSLLFELAARDEAAGTGVAEMSAVVSAVLNGGANQVADTFRISFPTPVKNAWARDTVGVDLRSLYAKVAASLPESLKFPDTVRFGLTLAAQDGAGNADTVMVDRSTEGVALTVMVVQGRTVMLPDGGVIADAVVDTARQRLYLSNHTFNKVEVLDLAAYAFTDPIRVGSEPWGLFLNATEDTLLVANSGGTNISFVSLDGTPREHVQRRLLTPNAVLYEVPYRFDDAGGWVKYSAPTVYDFSDRPQFVAQDSAGIVLYSTVPTGSAPDGTIRYVIEDPDPLSITDQPEVKLLFTPESAIEQADEILAIAHVDSLKVWHVTNGNDLVEIWDHVPGYPNNVIYSGMRILSEAVDTMRARGSDLEVYSGRWIIDGFAMSDTTFVTASGDRGWVAFGEGATAPTGRIILWNAANRGISSGISVIDLVHNASERVTGVGLNHNGSLGVARGQDTVYTFTNDLRLQGRFGNGMAGGGAGAALHPNHDEVLETGYAALAFAGTGTSGIKGFDTSHYHERANIAIRDNIIGQLKASLPFPSDNAGKTCPGDPSCVVIKLYGVTSTGGVVVVNVREMDIKP